MNRNTEIEDKYFNDWLYTPVDDSKYYYIDIIDELYDELKYFMKITNIRPHYDDNTFYQQFLTFIYDHSM